MKKLAVLDVGGSAIKYCTMCGPGLEGKGEVPTPDGESHDPEPFLEAIEGILARMGDVEGLALSMPERSTRAGSTSGRAARCSTTTAST